MSTKASSSEKSTLIETSRLEHVLEDFAQARNWSQFHSPKNLVMALSGEVGELTALFQWLTEEQSRSIDSTSELAQNIQDEMADVLLYLTRLASVLGVDLNTAVERKLLINEEKYPAGKFYGSSKKYNEQ